MDYIQVYKPYKAKNQKKYVLDCLDTNMLTYRGKYVSLLEEKLASTYNLKHCISTFNGSVSLFSILHSLGIGSTTKDEVIAPSLTYAATISQIELVKATPVLIDSDNNLQMDLNQIKDSVTKNTKAILVPELYSDAPNMQELVKLAEKYGILLIEDSAESFLCKQNNKLLGTYGIASSFSFFANKSITFSEGGAILTNDDELGKKIRLFNNQNHIGGFQHIGAGSNFRLTNIQAAIGLAQLEDISTILNKKRSLAEYYRKYLPLDVGRINPNVSESSEWMPLFKLPENITYSKFHDSMIKRGIEIRPAFTPIHLMRGFKYISRTSLKNSETVYKDKFNLPSYPDLTKKQLEYIVNSILTILREDI